MPIKQVIEKSIFSGGISLPNIPNAILCTDKEGNVIGKYDFNIQFIESLIENKIKSFFKIFDSSLELYIIEGIIALLLEGYCALIVLSSL